MKAAAAFKDWDEINGVEVIEKSAAGARYGLNTIAANRSVLGALKAHTVEQIQEIVRVANKHKVPLFTISTGHNWGYGSSLPAKDECVILDLSGMNNIIEVNDELAYATLEPGVTQQQLYDHLQRCGLKFMVPTTGAGPHCSLVGNALEKGFGITPAEDHWGAVLSIKAVLPNGEIYHSAIAEFGGYRADTVFKWKLGPYVEGLFVQGNAGIVVQATIALARQPENITQFIAFIDDAHFELAVTALSSLKQRLGYLIGGVNMMNRRRLLSMMEDKAAWAQDITMPEMHLRELAKRRGISDWVIMGGIYCSDEILPGIQKRIKKNFDRSILPLCFSIRNEWHCTKSCFATYRSKNIKICSQVLNALSLYWKVRPMKSRYRSPIYVIRIRRAQLRFLPILIVAD
jgi:4-cresol dehydrogenase (hydroxylating)